MRVENRRARTSGTAPQVRGQVVDDAERPGAWIPAR
jgi:hypothetical protein